MRFLNKEKGFSLAETLIVLLIVAIVIIALAPMLTKKKNNLNANAAHGKWACKYIGDELHSATAMDTDSPLGEWKAGCDFPMLAKNVKYLWVEVYGAGGGGARGNATPWVNEKKSYPANAPIEREGEYDLSYAISDFDIIYPAWDDIMSIYSKGSDPPELKKYCGAYAGTFRKYVKESKSNSYASCASYSYPEDKCTNTGDEGAIKTTDCIKSAADAGTHCWKGSSQQPPNGFYDADYFLAQCIAEGKEDCKISSSGGVNYTTHNDTCPLVGSLPFISSVANAPGVYGSIYMKKGEYIVEEKKAGKLFEAGRLGGYDYTESKDGNDYKIYHIKTSADGGLVVQKLLMATMEGPKTGHFVASGVNCCSTCTDVEGYPNSKGKSGSFCEGKGDDGKTKIEPGYSNSLDAGNVYGKTLSLWIQKFYAEQGCYGENGSHMASLFPSSGKKYVFQVGKGGIGAQGPDNNTINVSAGKGEDTYFGWVSVPGGFGGRDNCVASSMGTKPPVENPYGNDIGVGGDGGSVTYPKLPERNYSLPVSQDKEPAGRWKVEDGKNGSSGMIIVSW